MEINYRPVCFVFISSRRRGNYPHYHKKRRTNGLVHPLLSLISWEEENIETQQQDQMMVGVKSSHLLTTSPSRYIHRQSKHIKNIWKHFGLYAPYPIYELSMQYGSCLTCSLGIRNVFENWLKILLVLINFYKMNSTNNDPLLKFDFTYLVI